MLNKLALSGLLIWLSIFPRPSNAADHLGVLGSKPKWNVLEHYQRTITHDEFVHLINDVYCTHGIPSELIKIDNDAAQIVTDRESSPDLIVRDIDANQIVTDRETLTGFTLQFAPDEDSKARIPRLWRPAKIGRAHV